MGVDLYLEDQQNAPRLLAEAVKRECALEARVEELESVVFSLTVVGLEGSAMRVSISNSMRKSVYETTLWTGDAVVFKTKGKP